MISVAVIGAAGRTGRIIVEQALSRGHRVTAVVRRAGAFDITHPQLSVITADLSTPGALHGLLDHHDVVISALGAAGRKPTTLYSTGTREIIAAVAPGARLLVISSAGLAIPTEAGIGTKLFARLVHRVMRHVYTDMARMEDQLRNSELTWTAVRPTHLTDQPRSEFPQISIGASEKVGAQTSRADLADYLLDAMTDPHTHNTTVALSSQ